MMIAEIAMLLLKDFFNTFGSDFYVPSPLRVSLGLIFCRNAFKSGKRILWHFQQWVNKISLSDELANFLKYGDVLEALIITQLVRSAFSKHYHPRRSMINLKLTCCMQPDDTNGSSLAIRSHLKSSGKSLI